jgi:uncharacterized protein (UPF0276 family)
VKKNKHIYQNLGYGLGLRHQHFTDVLKLDPDSTEVDWFEIISENYMVAGGKPRYYLDQIKERFPVIMHGVSLSIGSTDDLNMEYLKELKKLANHINPLWMSDHLCWTGLGGHNLHDLLPLPYNKATLNHVAQRIKEVQDYIERPFLIENASSYLTFKASEITEWDFLSEIVDQADCGILLDVNNIFVSGFNHDFEPLDYLKALPKDRIGQIHIAGHEHNGDYIVDTHDHPVCDDVWELYEQALKLFGPTSSMIERDDNIPPLQELIDELNHARMIGEKIYGDATIGEKVGLEKKNG